jgi:hypothetical protein
LSVQSLVPVAVEQRPLPQLYQATVIQGRFGNEALCQITDEDRTDEHKPQLFSFRNQGESRQRTAYLKEFSFRYSRNFRDGGYVSSSIKSNFRLSGTYDVNGELYIRFEEKGIYINQFS